MGVGAPGDDRVAGRAGHRDRAVISVRPRMIRPRISESVSPEKASWTVDLHRGGCREAADMVVGEDEVPDGRRVDAGRLHVSEEDVAAIPDIEEQPCLFY